MTLPVTKQTACQFLDLPQRAGEIPTAQAKLDDIHVADFASWLDDNLHDLEFRFQSYWTHQSTRDAICFGTKRR